MHPDSRQTLALYKSFNYLVANLEWFLPVFIVVNVGISAALCVLRSNSVSTCTVGGVAQWLGRRSLACGLSLIYAWSMVDMWPLCGWGVRYGSTNQANLAFHPSGVGKWVVIHGLRGRRPLNGRPGLRMAVSRRSGPALSVTRIAHYR